MYADGKFYGKIRRTAYANRATRVSVVDGTLIEIRSAEHIRSKAVTSKCHHRERHASQFRWLLVQEETEEKTNEERSASLRRSN